MHVARLSLTDYRNYAGAELELGPGRQSARRKQRPGQDQPRRGHRLPRTLGSHRVSSDQPLIRSGAEAAIIRALLAHGDRELLLEVQLNRTAPTAPRSTGRR